MPYTQALMESIPKLGNAPHTRLNVIGGRPPDLIDTPAGCNFAPRCPHVHDKCLTEEPPLTLTPDGEHAYACWFPVGDIGRKAEATVPDPDAEPVT